MKWQCDIQANIEMKGGGGGSAPAQTTQNTVQKSDPWEGQQPYLERGFEEAESQVLERPLNYFPDSTVVPYSQETNTALNLQTGRALGGLGLPGGMQTPNVQLQDAARGQMGANIAGNYTAQGNPYTQGIMDRAMNTITPAIDAKFGSSGRFGSTAHAEALGRGVGDAVAPSIFQNYEAERGRQMAAAGAAPGFAAQDYGDIASLSEVGSAREALSQEQLADQIARFNFEQGEPTNRLAQYMNLIQGQYGGNSTQSMVSSAPRGQGASPLLSGLGGGLAGAGLGSMAGFDPLYGAIGGAGIGLFG